MNVFYDFLKRRILVIYYMLKGITLKRFINLLISLISMVLKRSKSGKVPPQLIIKITSRCNYSCIMCPKSSSILGYYDDPVDMDYQFLERMLTQNAKYISIVKLFGGEPLYHKRIIDIIHLLNNLRLKYTITTNGFLLTKEVCHNILRNCVRIYISLDAVENDLYKKMRRGGDLSVVTKNIQMLNQIKIQGGSKTPVLRAIMTVFDFNLDQMPEMVEFCSQNQIRYLVFQEGVFYGNDGVEKKNLLTANLRSTEEIIEKTRQMGKIHGVHVEFDLPWFKQYKKGLFYNQNKKKAQHLRLHRCFYLYFTMLIQEENKHTYCFATYDTLDKINGREIAEIWNAEDGIYYQGRTQLRHNKIPHLCKKAYDLGGKCALTMVVEEKMLERSNQEIEIPGG